MVKPLFDDSKIIQLECPEGPKVWDMKKEKAAYIEKLDTYKTLNADSNNVKIAVKQ